MKLFDALSAVDDNEVVDRILTLYKEDDREYYEVALSNLRSLEPGDGEGGTVAVASPGQKGLTRYDTYGLFPGSEEEWSLSLTEWPKALDMEIAEETVERLGLVDTVAHIVWEIAWHGNTVEGIEEVRDELHRRLDEIEKHKDDPNYFTPWEDIKKRLEDKLEGNG